MKLSRWQINGRNSALLVAALAAAFLLGRALGGGGSTAETSAKTGNESHEHATEAEVWTCAMHPQFQLPAAGQCPICFMDLIPLEDEQGVGLGPSDLMLSEAAVGLAEIVTTPVRRRFVTREVKLIGTIAADESRTSSITARVAGRLEKLHVNYTGDHIDAGQALAEIYSPALYAAQAELLAAVRGLDAVQGARPNVISDARATLAAVRRRLQLWGMGEDQIDDIIAGQTVNDRLLLRAPVSGVVLRKDAVEGQFLKIGSPLYTLADLDWVWVVLKARESDLSSLRQGQQVEFTVRAWASRVFTGEIIFIDPVVHEKSRSVDLRVAVANHAGLLKPGMLVRATVSTALDAAGMPIVNEADALAPLVIPVTAPLRTGDRAVVYVRDPQQTAPTFTGRQVQLGPRAGDFYVVESGLEEGEEVVVQGNFKIDSALQIQARPSMMDPNHPETPATHAASPELKKHLTALLDNYLVLQQALSGEGAETSRLASEHLSTTLANAAGRPGGLTVGAHQHWHESHLKLTKTVASIVAAGDIADRRIAFQPLSDELWQLLESFAFAADSPVRRFHCPMAFDFAGADWIQQDATTANPYFGATMLRCGTEKAQLAHKTMTEESGP